MGGGDGSAVRPLTPRRRLLFRLSVRAFEARCLQFNLKDVGITKAVTMLFNEQVPKKKADKAPAAKLQ